MKDDDRYMILTTDQKVRGSTPFGCTENPLKTSGFFYYSHPELPADYKLGLQIACKLQAWLKSKANGHLQSVIRHKAEAKGRHVPFSSTHLQWQEVPKHQPQNVPERKSV